MPNTALVGFDSAMATVSSGSTTASLTTLSTTFWLVTPGVKVSVPLARV